MNPRGAEKSTLPSAQGAYSSGRYDAARPGGDQTGIELVRMAFRELAAGTWASTATALAFGIAVGADTPVSRPILLGWMVAMLGCGIYRLGLAREFHRTAVAPEAHRDWGRRFVTGTTLTGIGWGLSTWLFPTLDEQHPLGIAHVLILSGLATGSARLLLPLRRGSIAYLLVVMVPLALRFFAYGNLVGVILGGCVTMFIAYMTTAMRRNHATLADALAMRFEREALAAALQLENASRGAREQELREAREKAESASRAKGEFLATISHEIRTPMNAVIGMLRIVRDTPLSDDQGRYLGIASDSAESLMQLLTDVLDFSKIEAGRLELDQAPFQPAAVARSVHDLLHTRAREKGLVFDLVLAEDLPDLVVGDAARVRQILVNLVGNAIKFTERGGVALSVTCPDRTAEEAGLRFTVADTGIGIDPEVLSRLFKPFTQADNSFSRRYGGSGLGLAISKRLAEAMAGTIEVQSGVNRGTHFRLKLTCRIAPPPESAAATAGAPIASIRGARLLVVEDDPINQQVIGLFLQKLHLSPKFADDGESALAMVSAETFDLILMDCHLPGIDGMETTRRIRKTPGGAPPLKIIALTADATAREACLVAGMDDYLAKPVRLELLATVLQRHLGS